VACDSNYTQGLPINDLRSDDHFDGKQGFRSWSHRMQEVQKSRSFVLTPFVHAACFLVEFSASSLKMGTVS
jgi:hypothetical protein